MSNDSGHNAASRVMNKLLPSVLPAICFSLLLTSASVLCAAPKYQLEVLAENLHWPWSLAKLPDGSFLVTEREGRLLRLQENGKREILKGTPDTLFAGQGGYFDIVLHPSFTNNQLIYLSYAEGESTANGTAIFRAALIDGKLRGGLRILRTTPDKNTPQHYGGRMAFLTDGSLLLTTGDGFEMREEAQNRESELGKVLRVDPDGRSLGLLDRNRRKATRVWTLGHRNPQGILEIRHSGTIYLHEHGPKGGDEINLIAAGTNYGWPAVSTGVDYSGAYVTPFKRAQGMQDPLWTWTPSIAPSGFAWYAGNRFPEWKNSFLVGSLVYREVRRLQMYEGAIVREESLFSELDQRIRDIRVYGDDIYLLTDGEQAQLLHVRRP